MISPNLTTRVGATVHLMRHRDSATLAVLADVLETLLEEVLTQPNDFVWPDAIDTPGGSGVPYAYRHAQLAAIWPELGFYDLATGSPLNMMGPEAVSDVGDAIDDLTDILADLDDALNMMISDPAGGTSWLRFTADIHWGEHVHDLIRHLRWRGRICAPDTAPLP